MRKTKPIETINGSFGKVASGVVLPTPLRPGTARVFPGETANEIRSSTTVSPYPRTQGAKPFRA